MRAAENCFGFCHWTRRQSASISSRLICVCSETGRVWTLVLRVFLGTRVLIKLFFRRYTAMQAEGIRETGGKTTTATPLKWNFCSLLRVELGVIVSVGLTNRAEQDKNHTDSQQAKRYASQQNKNRVHKNSTVGWQPALAWPLLTPSVASSSTGAWFRPIRPSQTKIESSRKPFTPHWNEPAPAVLAVSRAFQERCAVCPPSRRLAWVLSDRRTS